MSRKVTLHTRNVISSCFLIVLVFFFLPYKESFYKEFFIKEFFPPYKESFSKELFYKASFSKESFNKEFFPEDLFSKEFIYKDFYRKMLLQGIFFQFQGHFISRTFYFKDTYSTFRI